VSMGSPCLGKRQGNLKKPDVNKVRYNLGYRLSHLIAIVSPSARSGGKGFGAWVSRRRCVSGGNGRALIIRDLERERCERPATCGEIERADPDRQTDAVGPSGFRVRRINLVCGHEQGKARKGYSCHMVPHVHAEINAARGQF
jgi:hypothetical protein